MQKTAVLFSACILFACAAPNPYRPLDNGLGYTEVNIARNRYEVMFHGSPDQDELTAKNYAILRAAEIAKHENFPYFRINKDKTREKESRETVRESETRSDPYAPYPRRYWGKRTQSRTVTYTEKRPVVKLTVTLDSAACEDCLSADAKIAEAEAAGILRH
ncbi:MAG: hypothetical protein JWO30_4410 [Fibrobacteres bacterium]|nr:hypothetical protein [Fibrobacterota bacterium]